MSNQHITTQWWNVQEILHLPL